VKATRFMRKPFVVVGFEITETNMDAVAKWCQGHVVQGEEGPFVRVPVDYPTSRKQTEGYVGTWVLQSRAINGGKTFKVYSPAWLKNNFVTLEDMIQEEEEALVVEPIVESTKDNPPACCDHGKTNNSEGSTNNVRALPTQKVNSRKGRPSPTNIRPRRATNI
jgi:hypothetical protein